MSAKTKICFFSTNVGRLINPGSTGNIGGAELQILTLARALSQDLAWEVHIVTQGGSTLTDRPASKLVVHYADREFRWAGLHSSLRFFALILTAIRVQADIYQSRAAGVEVGLLAWLTRLLGKKYVYMVASSADLDGRYRRQHPWRARVFEAGLHRATALIVQNKEQQAGAQQYNPNVFWIPNMLPETGLPSMTTEKRQILWVGSSRRLKQPEIFLDLAEQLPSQIFSMVISRHPSDQTYLQNILEHAAAIPNLTVHVDIPFSETERLFQAAALFVNTSTYEGFPNTFLQAFRNNVPVISLRVDPDQVLSAHGCGICVNNDVAELLDTTRRLMQNQARRLAIGQTAYAYVHAHHSISVILPKYKALYAELTNSVQPGV